MTNTDNPPKLKDIAQRVGVSESAASLALSGKPGVSDATRKKILAVAKEMHWEPNYAARVLAGSKPEVIGMVLARNVKDVGSEAFFMRFLTGIQQALSARGYGLLLQTVGSTEEELSVYRRWRSARRVDAVILTDLHVDDPRPRALVEMGMPAIITGAADREGLLPALVLDDAAAMSRIIDFLTNRGHQSVAYVCGESQLRHIRDRIREFDEHVKRAGGSPHVFPTDFSAQSAADATVAALECGPTAIIFDNEFLALAGMAAIRRMGMQIPDDVSVVVWEDSAVAQVTEPALTALQRDAFALGVRVTERLLALLDGREPAPEPEPEPALNVRASVRHV